MKLKESFQNIKNTYSEFKNSFITWVRDDIKFRTNLIVGSALTVAIGTGLGLYSNKNNYMETIAKLDAKEGLPTNIVERYNSKFGSKTYVIGEDGLLYNILTNYIPNNGTIIKYITTNLEKDYPDNQHQKGDKVIFQEIEKGETLAIYIETLKHPNFIITIDISKKDLNKESVKIYKVN